MRVAFVLRGAEVCPAFFDLFTFVLKILVFTLCIWRMVVRVGLGWLLRVNFSVGDATLAVLERDRLLW